MLYDTADFPDIPESEAAANQLGRKRDNGTFLPPGNEPFLSDEAVVADGDSQQPSEGTGWVRVRVGVRGRVRVGVDIRVITLSPMLSHL